MKFEEAIQKILSEEKEPKLKVSLRTGPSFPYPWMMQKRYPNAKKEQTEVKQELKKYNLTLKGYNQKTEMMTVQGTKDNIRKFALDNQWIDVWDEKDLNSYSQLKSNETIDKERAIDALMNDIDSSFPKEKQAIKKWFKIMIKENPKLTSKDINLLSLSDFKYDFDSDESISASSRASVWTTTLTGEIKIGGKKYKKEIIANMDVNKI
jgi:hypothetical protein